MAKKKRRGPSLQEQVDGLSRSVYGVMEKQHEIERQATCDHRCIRVELALNSGCLHNAVCSDCGRKWKNYGVHWLGWLAMRKIKKVFNGFK